MRPLWGRVAGLALLAGVLAVPATVGTAPAQAAVGTARPTAIALDSAGTSYVGHASGTALSRISVAGRVLAPLPLDQAGPVNGLATDSADRLWVAHDRSVSVLDLTAEPVAVVRRFDRSPGATCAHDGVAPVSRYGGITLTATQVVVADRCTAALEVYDRTTGDFAFRLPLVSRAHGLAWLRPFAGAPARLFVALPDAGTVQTFGAEALRATSRPSYELRPRTPPGGRRPVPAGVVVDRAGVLTVSDLTNHALYLYDLRKGYGFFRTLGHPASPGTADGYLDQPTALAQHPQDGSGQAGNLFVADLRNGRVQRWDVGGGFTFWARALSTPVTTEPTEPTDPTDPTEPAGPGTPANTVAPVISGSADALLCSTGTWNGGTASFGYQWSRDGVRVAEVTGSTYPLGAADQGTEIVCRVTATTTTGTASAASAPWFVGTPARPVNTSPPSVVGTAALGRSLTCATGAWTATPAPRFSYVWLRGSVQVDDTPSHVVTSADVGASLGCTVIATNQAGSTAASAAPVVPTGTGPTDPTDPDPEPEPTAPCTGTPRVTIAGGAAYVRRPQVTLTVVAPPGATGIEVSDDAAFTAPTVVTRSAACGVAWTLRVPPGDATPVGVWVRFAGATGATVTDTVRFDRTGPRLGAATVRFSDRRWLLRVAASDVSGVATLTFGPSRTTGLRTVRAAPAVRVRAPEEARWVRATDRLGNVSGWTRVR